MIDGFKVILVDIKQSLLLLIWIGVADTEKNYFFTYIFQNTVIVTMKSSVSCCLLFGQKNSNYACDQNVSIMRSSLRDSAFIRVNEGISLGISVLNLIISRIISRMQEGGNILYLI